MLPTMYAAVIILVLMAALLAAGGAIFVAIYNEMAYSPQFLCLLLANERT